MTKPIATNQSPRPNNPSANKISSEVTAGTKPITVPNMTRTDLTLLRANATTTIRPSAITNSTRSGFTKIARPPKSCLANKGLRPLKRTLRRRLVDR